MRGLGPVTKPRRIPELKILENESNLKEINLINELDLFIELDLLIEFKI